MKNLQILKNKHFLTKMLVLLMIVFVFTIQLSWAQQTSKYNLRFVEVRNDEIINGLYEVLIQIQAEDTSFILGNASISFNYNKNGIINPGLLTSHNFSNGGSSQYDQMSFSSNTGQSLVALGISLPVTATGTTVNTGVWMDVATINFVISSTTVSTGFTWRPTGSDPKPSNPSPLIMKDHNNIDLVQGTEMSTLNVPLPVDLISFSAIPDGYTSLLNWSTASEINNQGFQIERSGNERNWETIDFVEGNGNATNINHYEYIDYNPIQSVDLSNSIFYRLKQVDYNGSYEYSDIQLVKFIDINNESGIKAIINPIPASNTMNISIKSPLETENMRLQFYNMEGKIVNEIEFNGFYSTIDISNMMNGIYQIMIVDNNYVNLYNTRIMINK